MYICHRDTYWKFISDNKSPYGLVAKLEEGLWLLDVSANLYGVLPGRYRVQWGLSLSNNSCASGVQFRVAAFSRDEIPEWHNEAMNSIEYTPKTVRHFLHHINSSHKEDIDPSSPSSYKAMTFIFQLPQVLVVDKDKPTLFVQMRDHGTYRSGLTVLFVKLVPAGEEEEDDEVDDDEVDLVFS
ncbi:hypothetical protein BGZ96_008822 [Linnemannia gamsii]|uniref:Uncharacterized protein n=1 Tax=Linnemannia gamsii TaxID=64522 RepID=A0ABQ7JXL7_9FUNG|nr:hypothetical protein BGZ96_008822 [Linnemannia gamsii]